MKKFIIFLVVAQMIIISMYGLLLLRGYAISSLINENTSSLMLVMDTFEEYQFFLDLAEREGIAITRPVFIDDTNLIIYTSDLSLDGRIELRNGRWPDNNSNEFVSVIDTGESNQVGIIHNVSPGFNVSISRIENTTNVELHGIYFINSIDFELIQKFVYELDNNIYQAELFSINNEVTLFSQITMVQLIELVVMSVLLFICILATFINHSINKLKSGSVLVVHGYSKFNIVRKWIFELSALLFLAFVISYMLLLIYIYLAGYILFLSLISLYFILIYSFLFLGYIIASNIFMIIYLFLFKTINILKGEKPYFILQGANYLSKIAFSVAILIFGSLTIDNFIELNRRLGSFSSWELAQNIHSTRVYSVGQATDLSIDLEIMTRKLELYSNLKREHNAFMMHSRNIFFLDVGLMPYSDMSSAPPMELSPHGYRITISPNFLEFNPITAVNGIPVLEQIIYDSDVLNVLVPEKLSFYEDEILRLYLDYFYFSSVGIDNIYNRDLGFELNTTPIENLSINIIYVENNQQYFSFDYRIRPQYGNNIEDPVAVLYTGSVHPSRLSETLSGNFFFHTKSIDAHNAILPLLLESGLSHVIRSTVSVFDQNGREIVELREQFLRIAVFVIILIISSITIVYALMSNYFEKNKQKIFIKYITGYTTISRHFHFLFIVLLCNFVVVIVLSLIFGYIIFLLGLILMVLDVLFMLLIDRQLTSKSFSKIIKGGA